MIRKDRHLLLILFSCFSLLMAACNQETQPCGQPKLVSVSIGCFYDTIGAIPTASGSVIYDTGTVDTFLPNAIWGYVNNNGAAIPYTQGPPNVNTFSIFLSSVSDTCKWFVNPDSSSTLSQTDTLTFIYTRQLHFLSNACGYTYYYALSHVAHASDTAIDSVVIADGSVTSNVNTENIKIYFKHNGK